MSPSTAATLAAVIHLHAKTGHVSIRDIQRLNLAGLSSTHTIHGRLVQLRDLGLVAWDPDRDGTLRPTVSVHAPSAKTAKLAALGDLLASTMADPDDDDRCENGLADYVTPDL